jgi:predicted MPP superfamily phosphohydrolase
MQNQASKKTNIVKLILVITAAIAMIAAAFAFIIEPSRTVVRQVDVKSPYWHGAPIKIALISDVHVDNLHIPVSRIEKTGKLIQSQKPDIIFIGGDYAGGYLLKSRMPKAAYENRTADENNLEKSAMLALGDYNKYAPLGAVAIMGNHDRWWSASETRKAFAQTQTTFLEDKLLHIKNDKFDFWICGLDDRNNWRKEKITICDDAPKDANLLTFVHNPAYFIPYIGQAKIQFSGHLHGGQIRFPFIGAPRTSGPYTEETIKGYMVEGDRVLVVSTGLGMVGLPARLNVPPEVMIINLSGGSETKASSKTIENYWFLR